MLRRFQPTLALILFVAVLLLGAALRLVNLDTQDIWGDEGFTVFAIQQPDVMGTVARDVHPPAYFLLLALWGKVAGYSELAVRLPSAWLSLLNVALAAVVMRELLKLREKPIYRWLPLLAALMMAIAEMESYTAQEARSYAAHVTIALISMGAFLRWRRSNQPQWASLWVMMNALMVHTHYLGVWTPITQGIFLLLFPHRHWRRGILLLVVSAISLLPWIAYAVLPHQLAKFGHDLRAYPSTLATLWEFRIPFLTHQWSLILGLMVAGTCSFFTQTSFKLRPFVSSGLLWLWVIVPIAGTFLLNLNSGRLLYDYRLSQITIPIALLTALGLGHFRRWLLVLLTSIIVIYGVTVVDMYRPKENWRAYTEQLTRFIAPDDALVLDFVGGDYSVTYYTQQLLPPDIPVFSLWQQRMWRVENYEAESLSFMAQYDTIWVGAWTDLHEAESKLRLTGHQLTARETFDHVGNTWDILRYDRFNAAAPLATFANGMVLHQAELDITDWRVDLLWSTHTPLEMDYTTSVLLLDTNGQTIAQFDSPPYFNQRPTSAWIAHDLIYDPKPLVPVGELPKAGQFQVVVQVYRWTPEAIEKIKTSDDQDFVMAASITLPSP